MQTHGLGLAVIRVIVGGWFFKAVATKLALDYLWWIPFPTVSQRFINFLPKRLAEFASDSPVGCYPRFFVGTVFPHARLFVFRETLGEGGVGVGLILGLVTSF